MATVASWQRPQASASKAAPPSSVTSTRYSRARASATLRSRSAWGWASRTRGLGPCRRIGEAGLGHAVRASVAGRPKLADAQPGRSSGERRLRPRLPGAVAKRSGSILRWVPACRSWQTGDKAATMPPMGTRRMALLFHSPDEDAQAWRQALLRRLPELEVRIWPDFGDPAAIEAALVWRAPPGLLAQVARAAADPVAGCGRRRHAGRPDPARPAPVPAGRPVDDAGMGEFVLTLVLKYHRRLDVFAREQRRARWSFALPVPPAATTGRHHGPGRARHPCRGRARRPRLHRPRLEPKRQGARRAAPASPERRSWHRSWPEATSWSACCR